MDKQMNGQTNKRTDRQHKGYIPLTLAEDKKNNSIKKYFTLSQTAQFRLFQTEAVCRCHFKFDKPSPKHALVFKVSAVHLF